MIEAKNGLNFGTLCFGSGGVLTICSIVSEMNVFYLLFISFFQV